MKSFLNNDIDDQRVSKHRSAIDVTVRGLLINLLLTIGKYITGLLGRSSAMIADATHSLSDLISDIVVIFGIKYASKPPDDEHPYGHNRFETLATFILGFILLLASLFLFYEAIMKIVSTATNQDAGYSSLYYITLIAALVSLISKAILYYYTMIKGKHLQNKLIQANAYHHLSDSYSSFASALGIGLSLVDKSLYIADPIAAVLVSFLIFRDAFKILRQSGNELADVQASKDIQDNIIEIIAKTKEIKGYHNLKTRYMGNDIAVDVDIEVHPKIILEHAHQIANELQLNIISSIQEVVSVMVHVDPYDEDAGEDGLPVPFDTLKDAVKGLVLGIPGVKHISELRLLSDHHELIVDVDIQVSQDLTFDAGRLIQKEVIDALVKQHNIKQAFVHLAPEEENSHSLEDLILTDKGFRNGKN